MDDQAWEDEEMRNDPPRSFVASGEWPRAELSAEAPMVAHYAQEVALRVAEALELRQISQAALSKLSHVPAMTISRVLRGTNYPDLVTLSLLEAALRADLYPTGLYRLHPPPPPLS